jgi:hypothetical protein
MGETEKCTYVVTTVEGAPSFSLKNVASQGLSDKYDVHFQEWIEGWELTKDEDYIEIVEQAAGKGTVGGTPFGHITNAKWLKAKKYNYGAADLGKTLEYGEVY